MKRLIITGRCNITYVKFKLDRHAIRVLSHITRDMGYDFTIDSLGLPRSFSRIEKWQDIYLRVQSQNFGADIIIGHAMIHMFVRRMPNSEELNRILDKYCVWAKPKLLKVKKIVKPKN